LRRFQGSVAESVRVPFARFRQFDDFLCCGGAERIIPPSLLECHEGHLVRDPQETNRLGVKLMALQVVPDQHGWQYVREFPVAKGNRSTGGELTRKEW